MCKYTSSTKMTTYLRQKHNWPRYEWSREIPIWNDFQIILFGIAALFIYVLRSSIFVFSLSPFFNLYRAVELFDIFFNICWNRETQQLMYFFVCYKWLVLFCEIWNFKQFDRNGGYLKFFIGFIYILVVIMYF